MNKGCVLTDDEKDFVLKGLRSYANDQRWRIQDSCHGQDEVDKKQALNDVLDSVLFKLMAPDVSVEGNGSDWAVWLVDVLINTAEDRNSRLFLALGAMESLYGDKDRKVTFETNDVLYILQTIADGGR